MELWINRVRINRARPVSIGTSWDSKRYLSGLFVTHSFWFLIIAEAIWTCSVQSSRHNQEVYNNEKLVANMSILKVLKIRLAPFSWEMFLSIYIEFSPLVKHNSVNNRYIRLEIHALKQYCFSPSSTLSSEIICWTFSRAVVLLFNWKYFWGWNLVWTMCRRHADDTRVRFRVRYHWQMTYVIRTSSGSVHVVRTGWQQLCIKPTGFLVKDQIIHWNYMYFMIIKKLDFQYPFECHFTFNVLYHLNYLHQAIRPYP